MASNRTTPEYLNLANRYSGIVPGLRKYANRKRLSSGEKAYISRAANAARDVTEEGAQGFRPNVLGITERQRRNLAKANSDVLIDKTVNGVRVRGVSAPPGVRRIGRVSQTGNITYQRSGRTWHTVPVDFDQSRDAILSEWSRKVRRVARRHARARDEGRMRFGFWTAKGQVRANADPEQFIENLRAKLDEYKSKEDASDEDVFFGFQWSIANA